MVTSKSAGEVAFVMADMADSIMSVEEVIVVCRSMGMWMYYLIDGESRNEIFVWKSKRSHFKISKRKKTVGMPQQT